jgi:hypothetical protein
MTPERTISPLSSNIFQIPTIDHLLLRWPTWISKSISLPLVGYYDPSRLLKLVIHVALDRSLVFFDERTSSKGCNWVVFSSIFTGR